MKRAVLYFALLRGAWNALRNLRKPVDARATLVSLLPRLSDYADGQRDATEVLQRHINLSLRVGFPPGTYRLSEPIRLGAVDD